MESFSLQPKQKNITPNIKFRIFEFKAAGLHRPPSDSVRTFVVIITSVNKEPGVIILHVNGKDITSALRINSKVNRMNRVNLCINSPAL